jgi:DDB1- and CUL4-associated factor 5
MSVRFNQKGTHVLGLRRRREALIYPTHSEEVSVEFDNPGYYNSCTMKSCCFAGPNDEYVLWKVPDLVDNGLSLVESKPFEF